MPSFVRELVGQLRASGADVDVDCLNEVIPSAVAIMMANGTEVGIALQDGDVLPQESASPYPVGESPEEIAEAELAAIREDVKDGVFDDMDAEEEAYGPWWETARS